VSVNIFDAYATSCNQSQMIKRHPSSNIDTNLRDAEPCQM